jgi:hypothetical protein
VPPLIAEILLFWRVTAPHITEKNSKMVLTYVGRWVDLYNIFEVRNTVACNLLSLSWEDITTISPLTLVLLEESHNGCLVLQSLKLLLLLLLQ